MNRFALLFAAALATAVPVWSAPVTAEDCVRAALAGNPDLAAASARVAAASAAVDAAESAYYPAVGVAAAYTRTDNPPQAFMMQLNQRRLTMEGDFNQPEDTENLRVSATARLALFDGTRSAGRAAALADEAGARGEWTAVRNALAHEVRRAYYGVRQAAALAALADETLASMDENLRVARERKSAGQALQSDVLNIEVARAEAEEQSIRAKNRLELSVAALNTAVGEGDLTAEDVLAAPLPAEPARPDADEARIEDRPELAAARAALRSAESRLRAAKSSYAPRVSAFGSVDGDSEADAEFEQSYFAGVMAEWDVFTGFRRGAGVAAAARAADAARASVASLRNRLLLEYRSAAIGVREAAQRLDVAGRSRESAAEALRITRARYAEGAADVTELLTAQTGLTANRVREESARYDLWPAASNLRRAGGDPGLETERAAEGVSR